MQVALAGLRASDNALRESWLKHDHSAHNCKTSRGNFNHDQKKNTFKMADAWGEKVSAQICSSNHVLALK